jgi:hypothetical protein
MALYDGILGSSAPTEAAAPNSGDDTDGIENGDQGKRWSRGSWMESSRWGEGRPRRPAEMGSQEKESARNYPQREESEGEGAAPTVVHGFATSENI